MCTDRLPQPWQSFATRIFTGIAYRSVLVVVIGFSAPQFALQSALAAQPAPASWRVTEVWRVDGSEHGEPFGNLRDFAIGKDGTIWALDFKDQRLRRFDNAGKELPSVGRKGSGPGEMRNANGLVVQRDGSVWVVDPSNARLTVFDAAGKFSRQFANPTSGYGYRWNAWIDRRSGELVDQFMNQKNRERPTMDWRRISTSGVVRDTLSVPTCGVGATAGFTGYRAENKGKGNTMGQYPFTYGGGTAPDSYGNMWCATASSTVAVLVRIGTNDTVARTTLVVPAMPVEKAERDTAIAQIRKVIANYEINDFDPAKIPSTKPGIVSLTVDDDARLWVQHVARAGENAVTFDVHDRTGKHLGRLKFPSRPSVEGLPIRARGNDVWLAVMDDDDVVSIARFRISR